MRVDLITGFLGAGKTTFLRRYLRALQSDGEKIRLIENEFGPVNTDTMLLRDVTEDVDDLAGCCMCCTGKDTFVRMLCEAAMSGYDRVLVEPSGIYDVDEFFSVVNHPSLRDSCEIGSILTIVDAAADEMPDKETGYLMYAQLLAAGEIILSKTQLTDEAHIAQTIDMMHALVTAIDPDEKLDTPICTKAWDDLTQEDFKRFSECGYHHDRHLRQTFDHMATYDTFMTGGVFENEEDLKERLHKIMRDKSYGKVLRAKGHLKDRDGVWYEINCTAQSFHIRPVQIKRGILVVIGEKLDQDLLKELFA